MKPLVIVGSALILMFALACGGGSSSSPSSPSAPSTPTPTSVTLQASAHVTVMMDSRNDTEANQFHPWTGLSIGHEFLGSDGYRRSFGSALKFNLPSQVTGRSVTKATLALYVEDLRGDLTLYNPDGPTASMNIQLRANAFTDNWDPASLSWNVWASLGVQSAGEGLAYAPNQKGPVNFDITAIARNWASGTWPNRGIKLAADQYPDPGVKALGTTTFCSPSTPPPSCQRPELVIEYQ